LLPDQADTFVRALEAPKESQLPDGRLAFLCLMEGLLNAFAVWNMAVQGIGCALRHSLGDHAADDAVSEHDGLVDGNELTVILAV
jgi:hypothetical protein